MGLPELVTVAAKEVQLAANQSLCIGNALTTGAANLIVTFGSDEQKEEYCENMFNGTWSGTMCLTEPHAGSAVGDIITTAVQQPDGHYLIKGTKQFITTGDHDMSGKHHPLAPCQNGRCSGWNQGHQPLHCSQIP